MKRFILISTSKPDYFDREVGLAISQGYEPYGNITAYATQLEGSSELREYYATFMRLNDDIWAALQKPSKESK